MQLYIISLIPLLHDISRSMTTTSGVATGWHGWTMFRGPRAKGVPRETKKKMNNREEKKKRKERTKLFKYPDGGPNPINPHESK